MAAYANIDIEDKNFAAKLKKKLTQWGYEYKYSRTKVEITKVPENAEDQLSCLLQRELDLDIRINVKYFAIFFYELCYNPTFVSAPWEVRVKILNEKYGIEISRKTLYLWTKKLIEHNYIGEKTGIITLWKTYYENGEKQREKVENDDKYFLELKIESILKDDTITKVAPSIEENLKKKLKENGDDISEESIVPVKSDIPEEAEDKIIIRDLRNLNK